MHEGLVEKIFYVIRSLKVSLQCLCLYQLFGEEISAVESAIGG